MHEAEVYLELIETDIETLQGVAPERIDLHSNVTIGRGSAANVHLNIEGNLISREHATISLTDDGNFIIEDLKSINGIAVNNKRKLSQVLSDGDLIQFGGVRDIKVNEEVKDKSISCAKYIFHSKIIKKRKRQFVEQDENDINTTSKLIKNKENLDQQRIVDNSKQMNELKIELKIKQEELDRCLTKNESIMKKFDELKSDLLKSNSELEHYKSEAKFLSRARKDLEDLKKEKNHMHTDIAKLIDERDKLREENKNHKKKFKTLSINITEQKTHFENQIEKMKSEFQFIISTKNEENEKLIKKLNDQSLSILPQKSSRSNSNSPTNSINAKSLAEKSCNINVSSLRSTLECSLCGDLLIDPVVLKCSHGFCRLCLEVHLRKKKSCCPNCNNPPPEIKIPPKGSKLSPYHHLYYRSHHLENSIFVLLESRSSSEKKTYDKRVTDVRVKLTKMGIDPDALDLEGDETNLAYKPTVSSHPKKSKTHRKNHSSHLEDLTQPQSGTSTSDDIICDFCGESGHLNDVCPHKLNDYDSSQDEDEDL